MSADIAGIALFPGLPVDGERKRADTAQGDDRRVARARVAADSATAAEHASENGRLLIEEDKVTGDFVYRIVDEKTGEVIRQWPREEVLQMQRTHAARGAILDRRI